MAARPVPLVPTAADQFRDGLAGGFSIEHAAAQKIAEDRAQRVLFVDDDRGIQDLAQRWLTASGFTVHSAMDGPSALRAFDEVRPDLVVLDVVMPGMNGFDTCREMRRRPGGLTVPIVMATGLDDHDSVERAFIAGASDFVAKPLNWTALRHRLRYLLRNSLTTVALRQSEAQLALAQRIARIGSWEIDYPAGVVRLSEEVYRIFGVDSTQPGVSMQTMLASIHPQDRDAFQEGFASAVGRHASVDQVHRVVLPGGHERIVHQRAETQYRQDGAPLRTLGTVQDVTERAQAERALRLTRYALDNVSEAAFLIDQHGTIRYVNGSACRVLGYSQEEMLALHVDQISKSSNSEDWAGRWADLRARGAVSYETQHRTKTGDEIPVEVHASFFEFDGEEYVLRFARDISDRKLQEGKVHFLAYYDVLTGLPNRKLFEDWLHTALARAKREHKTAALLFVDLDHFKRINDSLGHKVGDDLLKGAADRLLSSVRGGDTVGFIDDEPEYVVSRWGGDEFTVLLPEIGEAYDAGRVAQRILDAFAEPFVVDGREMSVSSSIGIAIYPLNGTDAVSLMRNADTAMYSAKSLGRSGFQFYSSSMNEAAVRRLDMEAALRKALERGELLLHYQPQIDLSTGSLVSVEALVRWAHPQLGLVSPLEFIPLAEDTGLIVPIGLFVLETAIRQVREWESQGLGTLRVAVNVSARQLQGTLLFEQVSRSLVRSGLDPARLELEITESLLMEDAPAAIDLLDRLKHLGLRLAIDDFGTGYSSLSYLRRFPVDALKIDRTFVRDVHSNLESAGVVSTIIALARSLGLEVVAEGVENVRQRDWLLGAGDIVGQGYLYSPPLPAQEFVAWALDYRARSASQWASLQPSMSSAPDVR
ncbi:MAG: EAL domain-containing protein [Burkholderiaceae bacterium]